jgi:hypothetical protein
MVVLLWFHSLYLGSCINKVFPDLPVCSQKVRLAVFFLCRQAILACLVDGFMVSLALVFRDDSQEELLSALAELYKRTKDGAGNKLLKIFF